MSVSAIGAGQQGQTKPPAATIGKEAQNPGDASQVSKLNAEIKQAEAEIQKTLEEVQKAAAESIGGPSDKAQMLQSKLLMQQQEVITKQMQVKKLESPKNSAAESVPDAADARPRFDRYVAEQEDEQAPDNVYRLEKKDGAMQIAFHGAEE